MSLNRRSFLASASALPLLSFLPQEAIAREVGSLSFLVLGDWGKPDLTKDAARVASQMAKTAAEADAQFIKTTGDNFYEAGVSGIDDPLWQKSFEEIYSAEPLQRPWYVVLGNHDHHGRPDAELAYALVSERWTLPARYYVQKQILPDGTRADFFFIDTEALVIVNMANRWFDKGADAEEQLEWLDTMLEASPARWKFVVGHHPIYSGGQHGDTQALVDGVLPLLKRHGVKAYINGHDHDLQHIEREGIHFLTSGGGAEFRPTTEIAGTLFAASSRGFLSASLSAAKLDFSIIDDEGKVLHQHTVSI